MLTGVFASRSDGAATFDPQLSASVTDASAGAASDVTVGFDVPAWDVNFAAVVIYIPAAWHVTPGGDIPINARVGELNAEATLGLINGACATRLPVEFDMRNASIDANDTVSFLDADGNGTQDFAEDGDGNGVLDGIDHYPDFISRIVPGPQPISRSAGITFVAGIPIFLQFLVFEPATVIIPIAGLTDNPATGYPSVTLLQNIGDPAATPVPFVITDFCSPLSVVNVSYGMTRADGGGGSGGGEVSLRNPAAAGTYTFTSVALGQRDADLDGYENGLDTCPLAPNVGNPRETGSGDADNDGLDAACDPNDSPSDVVFGDVECNGGLSIGDAQKIARKLISLAVSQEPGCAEIGSVDGTIFGDVDCSGSLTIGDAQKVARKLINLAVTQETGCTAIGHREAGTNSDQDGDGYLNRQDNCPLVVNGESEDNQRDVDMDQIGAACDPDDTVPTGDLIPAVKTADVQIGGGG
ncbi:MAG: thrombospondin type 3 repeat-containing protein [Dehalococcoidia bacterium]|nr:thrombospondin type 3 repeat-containing protein [Dehalococcoidia bacterium]